MKRRASSGTEFGDYQTPIELADRVCLLLSRLGISPASILEPTCGRGSFLTAALRRFPAVKAAVGVDINPAYVHEARSAIEKLANTANTRVMVGDCFKMDRAEVSDSLPDPLLILGNPPWVTNSAMGSMRGVNLPMKSNFRGDRGVNAITGKANFDISEWILLEAVRWMKGREATLAMLCKTTVARKVLLHAWKRAASLERCDMYLFDAGRSFGVKADSCLLVVSSHSPPLSLNGRHVSLPPCENVREDSRSHRVEGAVQLPPPGACRCFVHHSLDAESHTSVFGFHEGRLIANLPAYERLKCLEGPERPNWRSGIKHDCTAVMELTRSGGRWLNGRGESVEMEDDFLYPMLKSSDLNRRSGAVPSRWMLVPQRSVGEDTLRIRDTAPRTWEYLAAHAGLLGKRASAVYRNRPPFSVFGVGSYTFAPWKVAVSGFYKDLHFTAVGPREARPVVFDDTCCFLACETEDEAGKLAGLLNSKTALDFFASMIFRDSKRPVTIELLRRLDLEKLAAHPEISG